MPRKAFLLLFLAAAAAALVLSLRPERGEKPAPRSAPSPPSLSPILVPSPSAASPSPSEAAPRPEPPSRSRTAAARRKALEVAGDLLPPPPPEIAAALDALREELSAPVSPSLEAARLSLLVRADYLEYRASEGFLGDESLGELKSDAAALLTGKDPYEGRTGVVMRGYLSPVDGTLQEYSLAVPPDYDPRRPLPLVVSLHHHGWTEWFRPFQGHPAPELEGALVLSPHARGSADYMWVALEEVLASIRDVEKNYAVDADRVYLTGYSMGGTGSWYVAVRRPHLFAAIAPVAGNADFTAWVKRWDWRLRNDSPFAFLREFLRESTCPAAYAENLRNVAVLCFHGRRDEIVPVEHARSMVDKLRALGYDKVTYVEEDTGHASRSLEEIASWLLEHRRERFPRKVSLKTNLLRHGRAYYVRLDGRPEPDRYSRLELEWGDPVRITTDNVSAFSILYDGEAERALPFPSRGFSVDGVTVRAKPAAGLVRFVRDGKTWREGPPPAGVRKRAGLEGPIEDAFRSLFLVVYGTGRADPALAAASREEAERFVMNWERRYNRPCPMKADVEVTPEDMERFNLVLYGAPWVNSVMARAADDLPFEITRKGVRPRREGAPLYTSPGVGVRFVFPNPLSPSRYVVVNASPTPAGLDGIDFRFGNWFDWIPYDNRAWYDFCVFDARTHTPESFLETGFFGPRWEFDDRWLWKGAREERAAAAERRVPPSALPPPAGEVWLDEVKPVFALTLKGYYNMGLSWSGGPLELGGKRFRHGIGVRPDSHLMWYLGGAFRRFTVTAGIDYGGRTPSPARRRAELVTFLVVGDGRILASSEYVNFENPVVSLEADVSGVEFLSLMVRRLTPEGWLYGPVCWCDPLLER